MKHFRSVRSIALYDACVLIKNTYRVTNGQRNVYEHLFHMTDLGSWEIDGSDIKNILSAIGIKTSSKIEGKSYSCKVEVTKNASSVDLYITVSWPDGGNTLSVTSNQKLVIE